MGLFGSLFGKKDPPSTDRCMECGMTDGRHTEWCPTQEEEAASPAAGSPDATAGERRPEAGAEAGS